MLGAVLLNWGANRFCACGRPFAPVPVVGGFVRWLYKRFVD